MGRQLACVTVGRGNDIASRFSHQGQPLSIGKISSQFVRRKGMDSHCAFVPTGPRVYCAVEEDSAARVKP